MDCAGSWTYPVPWPYRLNAWIGRPDTAGPGTARNGVLRRPAPCFVATEERPATPLPRAHSRAATRPVAGGSACQAGATWRHCRWRSLPHHDRDALPQPLFGSGSRRSTAASSGNAARLRRVNRIMALSPQLTLVARKLVSTTSATLMRFGMTPYSTARSTACCHSASSGGSSEMPRVALTV